MLEMVDTLAGGRVRQLGSLEFLAHVPGAEAEVDRLLATPFPDNAFGLRDRADAIAVSTGNGAGAPR